jgi:hypothetical protein
MKCVGRPIASGDRGRPEPVVVTDRPDPKFGLGSVWSIDLDPVYRPALTRLGLLLGGGVDELYNIAVDVALAVAAICTVWYLPLPLLLPSLARDPR